MSKLTWQKLLVYIAYFFAALAIVGIGFTLYRWILNPDDGQWEPLNVLADNAFNLFSAIASFVALRSSRSVPDEPVGLPFISPPKTLKEVNWQRHRENTLRNVETVWIDGYLKNAVHKSVEIELGIIYKSDAVSRDIINNKSVEKELDIAPEPGVVKRLWGIVLKRLGQENKLIPTNKSIYQIFEENGRSLLILGEPASGKTITMLQLAESLIEKAIKDEIQPIPLILNLSSWSEKRQPFVDWLVEEILLQYQVARDLTRSWVESGHVILLLDGLDEVAEDYRDECIETINTFKAQYSVEVVVCSRVQDYERLSNRLNLPNAILMQPLAMSEIDRYLSRFGKSTRGIRTVLSDNQELKELAESPLMLSIMPIVYGGLEQNEIMRLDSLEDSRRQLLSIYIDRMFERRPLSATTDYTQGQALHWLTNLAYGMSQHNQSIFYIERLQPSWLSIIRLKQQYRRLVGLAVMLFIGVFAGLLVGLSFGLIGGVFAGLLAVVVVGPGAWIGAERQIEPAERISWVWPSRKWFTRRVRFWFFGGLIVGLVGSLLGGVVGLLEVVWGIELIDGLFLGLFLGLFIGLLFGAIFGLFEIVFISAQISKTRQRLMPNQGIRSSGRNALAMGLVVGLIGGMVGGLLFGLTLVLHINLVIGLLDWLLLGLFFGLVVGLATYGSDAVLEHYTLRLLLARHNIIPFARDKDLIAYLDNMVDRILLRRVGGGWVFIHRYLLEYFASLHEETDS